MLLHKIKATHRNISAWYQCWYFFISAKQERTALVQWSRSSYPRDEWREVIRLFLLFLWSQWPEPQKVKMAAFLRAMNYGPRAELDLDWETLVHRGITVQLRAPHRQCVLALLRPTHPWPAPLAHTGPGSPTAFTGFICSLTSLIHHTAHSQPLLSPCPLYTSISTATLPQLLHKCWCSLGFCPGPSSGDFTHPPGFSCLQHANYLQPWYPNSGCLLESSTLMPR